MSYRTDCLTQEDATEKDREQLKHVLTTSSMKRLMGQALRELEGKKSQIAVVDLSNDQGIRAGLKLQGEIAGMARMIDLILEGTNLE